MDYLMSTVIATRELVRNTPEGTRAVVEVKIGIPNRRRANDVNSDWYVTVQVLGVGDDKVRAAFGIDAVQALYIGLKMAGLLISTSPLASEVEGSEDNFGFPETSELSG